MKDEQEFASSEKEDAAGRRKHWLNTSLPGLTKWMRLGLELSRWELGFEMELMRVEMRTGNFIIECSSLYIIVLKKPRQEIPLESLWFPRTEGKKTAKNKPKFYPRPGLKPVSHPGCPTP